LNVVVERDTLDGGFVAHCPAVPGAVSQGETAEEALDNLIDAVQGVVAAKMEERFTADDFELSTPGTISIAL
jgi:predicted RNase H-like HicB family nuclease